MTETLFMIYLSGAFLWAIVHGVLAVGSALEARRWQKCQSDNERYVKEAIGCFKAFALTPVWPFALLLGALLLLREMQDIARKDEV